MSLFIKKLGIDLGTTNSLVFVPGKGIILNEPTVVAISTIDNKVLAVGAEAKEMIGRTPETIVAHRPMKDGVISDYRITEAMLRYFIGRAVGSFMILKPDVMVSVPAGITSTERRAVTEATVRSGAKAAYVVKEPILAAIGAGLPINSAYGNMIVNIGGGTSEVAVIALGGIVSWASVRVAGNKIDQAIADYIKKKHNLAIGERTAEYIKVNIGSAVAEKGKDESMEIRGRDLLNGLPRTIVVKSSEITEAIYDPLREIILAIKTVLRETPPELAADIIEHGMVLSGGTALLRNIDQFISTSCGVNASVADEPLLCVAKGTGVALENLDAYKKSIITRR
ncbi:MAG: rod shape-determining protein [Candidatus Terrybacteria bacterium RIFCSPLOWO2_01_FULL_44_24]|uniref:Cell shape-determining protein MreB n=1 Tax=Candidatus Terrybacteria bacterium RIFCSPHIGHO2_01_FULL_43_35 TaxID=1802361 RepID=A0A1G2PFL4_9BACT|nr:MAG: rod shape-determining protein [Candidatus Terrybacteria bacterium RIFCSPHIGHO2_01_FULL_43_35]OHA51738.1 MAG: rod shape-determining protein [Candidatus Terrybacteria bacterium RIFCSPLOWO2_01_FULL_44_24]